MVWKSTGILLTTSAAHAYTFKWLQLEFADIGRTDVGLEKYLNFFGKERRISEKNSFEIASQLDIFAIFGHFLDRKEIAKFYKKLIFMLSRDIFL